MVNWSYNPQQVEMILQVLRQWDIYHLNGCNMATIMGSQGGPPPPVPPHLKRSNALLIGYQPEMIP